MNKAMIKEAVVTILKVLLIPGILYASYIGGIWVFAIGMQLELFIGLIVVALFLIPTFLFPLVFSEDRKGYFKKWGICFLALLLACGINMGYNAYDASITVNTAPNINTEEYMPFVEDTKIVKMDHEASLRLTEDLPRVDGAAAVFPVYSAFVNAVYPDHVQLHDQVFMDLGNYNRNTPHVGAFQYNNTSVGYGALALKKTDIFFGAYPSQEQIAYAKQHDTEFVYTPIGYDAFVFFVHKDNPIDNLTTEQIQGIYSGEITNWKELGGRNEKIAAFQRNQSSGSQSQLIRFMGDKPIMKPPAKMEISMMSGIVDRVSDYRSTTAAIGFSFRFYMEGIIQNPDIKLLSIDGIAPTVENIANGTYPITGPLYAVTWEGNENENVQKLLDWILSEEGQYIIEQTGYVPIHN